jgi:hypothetical protein
MSRFFGKTSVRATLRMHKASTGKVQSGTLKVRGASDTFTEVTWNNAYLEPAGEQTGLDGGAATVQTTGQLWQTGEAYGPRVDDIYVDSSSVSWLITFVRTSRNADSGYAVHQCSFVRMS